MITITVRVTNDPIDLSLQINLDGVITRDMLLDEAMPDILRRMADDIGTALVGTVTRTLDTRRAPLTGNGSGYCEWAGDYVGNWHTACGFHQVILGGGLPSGNGMRYCQHCGGRIEEYRP